MLFMVIPTLCSEIDRKFSSILESTCIKLLWFDGDDPSIIEVLNYLNTMDIYICIYIYVYIYTHTVVWRLPTNNRSIELSIMGIQ